MYRIELKNNEKIKFIKYMAYTYKTQPDNNIKNFIVKCKKENKIKTFVYPSYGKFNWHYNESIFEIEFYEEGKIQSTHDGLQYFTRLYIHNESMESIQSLIYDAVNLVEETEDENKVKLYVSKCGQYCCSWETFNVINVQTLENIFIDKKLKENLINNIDTFIASKEKYQKFGRNHKLNILLSGVAGSGKTSLCKALAKHYNYAIYIMNFNKSMTDDYMIELTSDVKDNSIILYEDIDAFFVDRTAKDVNISFSSLINILDGTLSKGSGIINIITTNYPDKLDSALLRPGRIDKIINFTYPKKDEIKEAFIALIGHKEHFEEFYDHIKNLYINMSAIIDYLFRYQDNYLDKNNINDFLSQSAFLKTITKEDTTAKLYI